MPSKEKTRSKIIAHATQCFFTAGYSKVSTEDLVAGLAMSKATLYKYFPSKEDLLDAVIDTFYRTQVCLIAEILDNTDTGVLLKIKQFMEYIGSRLSSFRTEAIDDFKRTVPEAYEKLMGFRRKIVLEKLMQLFQEGIRQGILREDLEPSFVVNVFLAAVEAMTRPEFLSRSAYSYDTVVQQVFALLLYGDLSEAGREIILRSQ